MTARVALRAASGPSVGSGHVRRTRAVAQALVGLGARALLVVDDDASAEALRAEGFDARPADERWTQEPLEAAWLDGFRDWSPELAALRRARTLLVESRTARERATAVLQPSLHWTPDAWEAEHPERTLGGPRWIPLAAEIERLAPLAPEERDVDLLVPFGASDPLRSTERVLVALAGTPLRVAVTVGAHMGRRRAAIEALAGRARVLAGVSDLGPWMRRSRAAVTAVGTTLYELAHLRVPAWVVANYESDREALRHYRERGPHAPLGLAAEVPETTLARVAAAPAGEGDWPAVEGGARRIAEWLLAGP